MMATQDRGSGGSPGGLAALAGIGGRPRRGSGWFEVDRAGLAKLLARRDKSFVIAELLQNAWDEAGVTRVDVVVERIAGTRDARIVVEDDAPDGFHDLAHAFTLFAESRKKGDPAKRGRFNFGEKGVLALCRRASICSTQGGWAFGPDGRRTVRARRERGSRVELVLAMTGAEIEACERFVALLLPPQGIQTRYNGRLIEARSPLKTCVETLPTEIADAEGQLRPTQRKTVVEIHGIEPGESGWLCEMGIPVVETGDDYTVNVGQKVPLNMDRDNVTPAYLRKIRTLLLNQVHDRISGEQANAAWARDALSDPAVADEAVRSAVRARFGDKVVSYDPSDAEANKRAVAAGYVVVHGGQMSASEWDNVRRSASMLPAGKVTPSPKPYSEGGDPVRVVPPTEWTTAMRAVAALSKRVCRAIAEVDVVVVFELEPTQAYNATWCDGGRLAFNLGRLGKDWPDRGLHEDLLRLIVHELGHHYSGDHLSREYHDALCRLGARLALAVAADPTLLRFEG